MAVLIADLGAVTVRPEVATSFVLSSTENEWQAQVEELLPRFDGRLVKTAGGETMCVFPSAEKGVMAASAIQAAVASQPPGYSEVRLQIGLHWGKVLVEGANIIGDTVNVAAYLAAVAAPEQIVTTEEVFAGIPDFLKSLLRPVFRTVLKGHTADVVVYEILWKPDKANVTDSSFDKHEPQLVPADGGGLLLKYGENTLRIDRQNRHVVLGRHSTCNLVIREAAASRYHARVELRGMEFYLNDISINGTFVMHDDQPEFHVVRREVRLDSAGKISFGRSFSQNPTEIIEFSRDRRALFRT